MTTLVTRAATTVAALAVSAYVLVPPADAAAKQTFKQVSFCAYDEWTTPTGSKADMLGAFVEVGHWSDDESGKKVGGCPYEDTGDAYSSWHPSTNDFKVVFVWRAGSRLLAKTTRHVDNNDVPWNMSTDVPKPFSSLRGRFVSGAHGWARVGKDGRLSMPIVLHVVLKKKGYRPKRFVTRSFRPFDD